MKSAYAKVIVVLFFCYAFSQLDRNILAVISTPLKTDLGLGDFQLSLLLGPAFGISYIAFGLPFGYLSDKWSRPRTIFVGLIIWMSGTAACGLSGSFAALFIFRMLVGAGEASLSPSAYAIIADTVPKQRLSISIAVYNWGAMLGNSMSVLLGGIALDAITRADPSTWRLLGDMQPWQSVFILVALPGLILIPLSLTLPESRSSRIAKPQNGAGLPMRPFLKKRASFLACHFVAFGLSNMIVYSSMVWVPQYLERSFGYSAGEVGVNFGTVMLVCPILGSLAVSLSIDRLFGRGHRHAHMRVYFWLVLVCTPFVCLTYLTSFQPLFWVGMLVIMTILNSIIPVASAALQITTPAEFRGRVSGAFISFVNITGAIVGPTLVGTLAQFVFRDEAKLGLALGTLVTVSILVMLPLLWAGSTLMLGAVADMEKQGDSAASCMEPP